MSKISKIMEGKLNIIHVVDMNKIKINYKQDMYNHK